MAVGTIDAISVEGYPESLYAPEASATPLPSLADWSGATDETYRNVGFVPVAGVFSPGTVQSVMDTLTDMVVNGPPAGVELQFESSARDVIDTIRPADRLDYVRKLMTFIHHDQRLIDMAYQPDLLIIVERLLGAAPELYQDMCLMKPPGIGREKPWHQDHAYFNVPKGTPIVGVWIALDEVTLDNGVMVFIPGGHREGPMPHFNRRDWQICDEEILNRKGQVAAPLPSGGALIFDGLIPHGTPMNRSGKRRRAMQFHYVPKGTPRTEVQERLDLFGAEGFGASC